MLVYTIYIYIYIFNYAQIFHCYDSRYHSYLLNGNNQVTIFFLSRCYLILQPKQGYKQEVIGHWVPPTVSQICHSQKIREKVPLSPTSPVAVMLFKMRKGLSASERKTFKAQKSLLSMNLAGIFLPIPILVPRSERETLISRVVLSPALLEAASNSKQKSFGFSINFHLSQEGAGLKYNFVLSTNNSASNIEGEAFMLLRIINCFSSTIKPFRNGTFYQYPSCAINKYVTSDKSLTLFRPQSVHL